MRKKLQFHWDVSSHYYVILAKIEFLCCSNNSKQTLNFPLDMRLMYWCGVIVTGLRCGDLCWIFSCRHMNSFAMEAKTFTSLRYQHEPFLHQTGQTVHCSQFSLSSVWFWSWKISLAVVEMFEFLLSFLPESVSEQTEVWKRPAVAQPCFI